MMPIIEGLDPTIVPISSLSTCTTALVVSPDALNAGPNSENGTILRKGLWRLYHSLTWSQIAATLKLFRSHWLKLPVKSMRAKRWIIPT
jgi:hypothetical protein